MIFLKTKNKKREDDAMNVLDTAIRSTHIMKNKARDVRKEMLILEKSGDKAVKEFVESI